MKKLISLFVVLSIFLSLESCTQPDGYIGKWFGSWHLESILINGETDTLYSQNPNIMFSFQGNIFHCLYLESAEIYGSWTYEGEILTLIAKSLSGGGANQSQYFNPFPVVMYLPANVEQVEITVTSITNKTMQWQYIDQNGQLLTYNFRKYP